MAVAPSRLDAQYQSIPPLFFTQTLNSTSNPLPQIFTVNSTGAGFNVTASATTTTGGNWLTVAPVTSCCNYSTPQTFAATATPDVNLAAGTYSGQITLSEGNPVVTYNIPVTLTVALPSAAYFDETPGGFTYFMQTSMSGPVPQALPIRNAGSGTLNWTSTVSTADGGNWLSLSAASGIAPATPNVSINPANLPNGGRVAGTFIGQVLLKTTGDSVTIPVTVTVGTNVPSQVNPLSFAKTVFSTDNPVSQQINIDTVGGSLGTGMTFYAGTGGSWLAPQYSVGCCNYSTPVPLQVAASPDVNLAAGTYTSQILITYSNHQAQVIPVTLVVEPATVAYLDALPGEITFSMTTGGKTPPAQPLPIRNAGTGTLAWSSSITTSDGGNWLTLSTTSGIAPFTPNVGLIPANLPSGGRVAGTFTGQIILQGGGAPVTVPVTVTVGDSVFAQINGLNFTKTLNSNSNPLSQQITIASTGTSLATSATAIDGTGGSWLSVTYGRGCCNYSTPVTLTVSANPDVDLAAGTYTAEILVQTGSAGYQAQVVPVTLTIAPPSAAYFDELPGQLTYSMQTKGNAPPAQLVQIRNAGAGTLNFTANAITADGGSWLNLSATNGTAPYLLNVSINPAALPNSGQIAGTFDGAVVLTTAGDTVTIPVTVTVGDSVMPQINPLAFSKTVNSANNPMPQVITLANTGTSLATSVTEVDGTGGSWLTVNYGRGCCNYSTPITLTATVTPSIDLPAGTYTSEIIIQGGNGTQPEIVPVTLTVQPITVAAFDALPGALTFSAQTASTSIVAQSLPIRNAGPGSLSWVATVSTADGGNWLTLDVTSGVAPSAPNVSVNPANLPNQGRVAGSFIGQVMLQSASGIVTIPVTVTIGDSVFVQPAPLNFTMSYQGANPASQSIALASTNAGIGFGADVATATGGDWLSINLPCCSNSTPYTLPVTAAPASPLPPGVYTGAVYVTASSGGELTYVPVTLTVTPTSGVTATPTFTPSRGTYTTAQSVAINDATTDAAIYYTTDGSTPTTSSTRYTAPVQVAASETLQAIAIAPAYPQSAVGAASYIINYGITISPSSYAFPNTVVGSTTMSSVLTLQNMSSTTLTGIHFSIAGTNAASFSLPTGSMGCGATLASGASCSFAVSFTPTLTGTLSAMVSIADSAPGSPQTVALSGTGDPNTPTTVLFDGIGSTSLYLALGHAASSATTASPAGLGATCLWTTKTLGVVVATDSSVNGAGKTDTGSAWVAWTPVGGSCSTVNATTVVYAYLAADSVVANRCLFNGCTVKYGGSGTASAGLINGTSEVPLAAGVVTALNGAGGAGLGVTAAGTDIRPEDAEFATARSLTPCGAAVAPGSQYLGLGYTNGSTVKSYYSNAAFNVINFALPSAYTVTPIGASPLVVVVNGQAGGNGFSDPAIANLTSGALALFLDGTFAQTQDGLTAPSTGTTEPITVLLREPLSGAYNLMEYGVVNTQSLKSSQDVGLSQQSSEMNCNGTGVKSNPLTLPSGAGFRRRTLSTAEELYEVSFRANSLGYAFWSAENFKTLTPTAAPYTKYLTIDGVDPLQNTYTGGAVPTTPAQLSNVTLANVANGSYPIWSVLRLVNIGATASTAVTNLSVAAQNFSNASAQPDFVPFNNLYAVHSHFIPPAGDGLPSTPYNGSARACSSKEAGGDVGGVVLTKAGDYDYCYDFGLTTGRTGLRR